MRLALLFLALTLVVREVRGQLPGRSDDDLGVSAQRVAISVFEDLLGTFDLSASEVGSDGSRFREHGKRVCRLALGGTAIQCEDERTLQEAVGRYTRLPTHRRSMRLLRWNGVLSLHEQVEIGVSGVPFVQPLTYDPKARTLSFTSSVESQSMRQTLTNVSVLTIAPHRHELVQRLRSTTTDFNEEYREFAVRRVK